MILRSPLPLLLVLALNGVGLGQHKSQAKAPLKAEPAVNKPVAQHSLLSEWEQAIVAEVNLARSNPSQYSRYVADFKRQYTGHQLRFADGTSLVTNEGVAAVDEAIEFLRLAKPAAPLEVRNGLVMAARTHLEDLVKTKRTGHKGSDGSNAEDRFSRFGTWSGSVGEDIVYHCRSARENVISLIIDDGVSNRGHRKNIFKSSFNVIGIALAKQPKSTDICLRTFAGGYIDRPLQDTKGPTATKF